MKAKQSRKEFLKIMATGLGIAVASPLIAGSNMLKEDIHRLTTEQMDLLRVYKQWLIKFNTFIDNQKADFTNMENNKQLIRLSSEAEEWKNMMAEFMEDKHFAAYYKLIIEETTSKIV